MYVILVALLSYLQPSSQDYNPSSHTTNVVFVNIFHEWWNILFNVDFEIQILEINKILEPDCATYYLYRTFGIGSLSWCGSFDLLASCLPNGASLDLKAKCNVNLLSPVGNTVLIKGPNIFLLFLYLHLIYWFVFSIRGLPFVFRDVAIWQLTSS